MRWSYRPELDGLRALAVVAVVLYHCGLSAVGAGFVGVDLFFVLSGFLVTHVVLSEVDRTGEFRVTAFYARRVRRLLPAAVVVVVVTALLFWLVASEPERLELVRHAQAALLYLANWQFILDSQDYFAADGVAQSPYLHFWSLSIEEQYYLVFPLLVLVWLKTGAQRERLLGAILGSLFVASLFAQVFWAQVDVDRAYYGTDTRLFQLLAGALLALATRALARRLLARRERLAADDAEPASVLPTLARRVAAWLLTAVGLALFVLVATQALTDSVSQATLLSTVAAVALIAGLYLAPTSPLGRLFRWRPVVYLGVISYGVYLWHWPIILVLERLLDVAAPTLAVLTVVLSAAVAKLSYDVLETPIRRSPRLDRLPRTTAVTGLACSLVVALAVMNPLLGASTKPAVTASSEGLGATHVSDELRAELEEPVPDLDYRALVDDLGDSTGTCTVEDPTACTAVEGSGPHVVLIGDSQARTMVPAFEQLAEEEDLTFSSSINPACPWQEGLDNIDATAPCYDGREQFYRDVLPAMEPDVVVLVSLARSDPSWEGLIVDAQEGEGSLHTIQRRATERTVQLIRDAGAAVVMSHSTIGTGGYDREGFNPLDCLSRASEVGDCVVHPPLQTPFVDGVYDYLADSYDDVATIDLNPVICPDAPYCRPVLDGESVWRNAHHLTALFATAVREQIWQQVVDTGLVD